MTSKLAQAESKSALRRARIARGLGQSELARRAGISRQALSAIESGAYQPGVGVALALARELGESVEALFGASDSQTHLEAAWIGDERAEAGARPHGAVALGRVGGRLVAQPQPSPALRLAPAPGVLEAVHGRRARVAAFRTPEEIETTLLVAGCDPAVTVLADWLGRQRSAAALAPIARSSRAALAALLEGRVHAAGVHLGDRGESSAGRASAPARGESSVGAVREALGRRHALMVNFARWELGLGVRHGNPLAIRSVADLARPGVRLANREPGSGARLMLDRTLAALKIAPRRIAGYAREFSGHLEVAAAIAAGEADTGPTLRVAAAAWNLDFVPICEERYDLVVLERDLQSAPVRAMLEALNSSRFARELAALSGYDTSSTGQVIARLN
ncbi:MAG TPA: substrate-binding domain-containing protein [Candidatus Binataceae bacterium]|jgi:molybdate-binding protein/DNA-binding XRE family transcriptional regulator|nr:substrate-binding domain-containing protein [Candidatus Binataceae bacterium]